MPSKCNECDNEVIDDSDLIYHCTKCAGENLLCQSCYEAHHHTCGTNLLSSWFRLVNLAPSTSTFGVIECRTIPYSWNERPDYICLTVSGLQGYPEDHVILLDGEEKSVTKGLYQSLLELRTSNLQYIWVTSLCTSPEHRESVQLMEKLASQGASQVVRFVPYAIVPETKDESDGEWEHDDSPVLFRVETRPMPSKVHKVSRMAHYAFCDGPRCAHSEVLIRGSRYMCTDCEDVDFCSRCIRDPENTHDRTHVMLETLLVSRAAPGEESTQAESEINASISTGKTIPAVEDMDAATPHAYIVDDPVNDIMKGEDLGVVYTIGKDSSITTTKISSDRSEMRELYPNPDGRVHHANPEILLDAVFGRMRRFEYPTDDFHRDVCSGIRATRVVDLCPGSGTQELRCDLRCIRLDDPPPYNALSYTWKETQFDRAFLDREAADVSDEMIRNLDINQAIYVGKDRFIPIGTGLRDALRRLRHPTELTTLWVDQLSINQSDLRERSLQVQYMDFIYNRAQKVIIWTGDSDKDSKPALELMERLAPMCRGPDHTLPGPDDAGKHLSLGSFEELRPVLAFFTRPVFGRIWVMQEIVLAQVPMVRCGEHEIEWWKVAAVANLMCQGPWATLPVRAEFDLTNRDLDGRAPSRVDRVAILKGLRYDFHSSVTTTLSKILYATRFFEGTRPEDRIYAVLGIRTARPERGDIVDIEVDYSKSVADTYIEAARGIINKERDITVLAFAGLGRNVLENLPTWAADWSSTLEIYPFSTPDPANKYRASGETESEASWPFPGDSNALRLKSYRVGRIESVSKMITGDSIPFGDFVLEACKMILARSRPYPGETDTLDAFLRTLLGNAGLGWSAYPAPDVYKAKLVMFLLAKAIEETPEEDRDSLLSSNPVLQSMTQYLAETRDFDLDDTNAQFAQRQFAVTTGLRKFFTASTGHLGITAAKVEVGDEVWILAGGDTPFVLKPREGSENRGCFLVGDAYVHGIMDGEAMEYPDFEWSEVVIH